MVTQFRTCDLGGTSDSNGVAQNSSHGCGEDCIRIRHTLAIRYASVQMAMRKNPHAVALGRLAAKARWKGVSKAERTAVARKAGKARWAGLTKAERSELAARGGRASRGKSKNTKDKSK